MVYKSPTILDIKLVNFARLYAGMMLDEIYIDFRIFDYALYVLVGDNGTGKTSLMSCLHPFAFNNWNSSSTDLILDGKDGYKSMHIGYDTHEYYIQHFYNRKKDGSMTIRSYIKEDDVELNETGSVTSFKDIVEVKLGIHENFLTLLFLGDSVKGFVDFTSGERKKYATKIFHHLQIYSKYHKNASAYARDIKVLLQDTGRKLEVFRGVETHDLNTMLNQLSSQITIYDNKLSELLIKQGSLNSKIQEKSSTISRYNECQTRLTELFSLIDKQKRKLGSIEDEVVITNRINTVKENIHRIEIRLSSLNIAITGDIEIQELKIKTKKDLELNMERMKGHLDFNELTELKSQLERQILSLNIESTKRPVYTSKDLIATHVYLDELRGLCTDLITEIRNPESVIEVLPKYQSDDLTLQKTKYHYESLSEEYDLIKGATSYKDLIKQIKSFGKQTTCDNTDGCFYYRFYETVMSVLSEQQEDTNDRLERKKLELIDAEDKFRASQVIKKLYSYINSHEKEFSISEDIFNPHTFIAMFIHTREIYDKDKLSSLIDLVERFEQYDSLSLRLNDTIDRLNSIGDSKAMYDEFQFKCSQLEDELKLIDDRLDRERSDKAYNEQELSKYTSSLTYMESQLTIINDLNSMRDEVKTIRQELADMDSAMKTISALQSEFDELSISEREYRQKKEQYQTQYQDTKQRLETLIELRESRILLEQQYNEALLVQEATSPIKGIPVDFLSDYMKGPLLHEVNRLLKPVYNGRVSIVIDECKIDDKEFTIPYRVGNTVVEDISSASEGQRAIFSLAFSLSFSKLINQINNWFYCIFLLDEKDAKLDAHSRSQFVAMITNFMDDIGTNQLFLSSHNAMFEGYPVNLLLTSNTNVSNMSQAQIFRVYESKLDKKNKG